MTDVDDQFAGVISSQRRETPPMSERGAEIAARVKETFFHYVNRMDRSQQDSLGPSEIGTPCDRRIALRLMRIPAVNPGGDSWASFVGTCIHAGLAEMFQWANAGTGRYATEVALGLPSAHVPKGTGDLLDRTLFMFLDHKAMGSSSLTKLRHDGPAPTYRVQVHTYGYAATLRGEDIQHVAIIGWPREAATLKGLYVWEEPYNEQVATAALARVDAIAADVKEGYLPAQFPIVDDCRYCPFHMPGAKHIKHGCNGKE